MPVDVKVGIEIQDALGTSFGATDEDEYESLKLDTFNEGPGYVADEGRPELGQTGLYVVAAAEKYGAIPFFEMVGKTRLEFLRRQFQLMGWVESGSDPGPYTYTPATGESTFPWFTIDFIYSDADGHHYQIIDARGQQMVQTFAPLQAPLTTVRGIGGNHQESEAVHAPYATETVPSPISPIPGANCKIFGVESYKVYGAEFTINNALDPRIALGTMTPDKNQAQIIASQLELLIEMNDATYRRLVYGGTAQTTLTAIKATGALSFRQSNGNKHVQYDYSNAEYWLGRPQPATAQGMLLVWARARCTATATATLDLTA